MRSISNAFFHQAEITQIDRWEHGPLELAFLSEPATGCLEWAAHLHDWNSTQRAGFVRSGEAIEGLKPFVPYLDERRNPWIHSLLCPTSWLEPKPATEVVESMIEGVGACLERFRDRCAIAALPKVLGERIEPVIH